MYITHVVICIFVESEQIGHADFLIANPASGNDVFSYLVVFTLEKLLDAFGKGHKKHLDFK